ncbi:MAG: MauE/DoxX family redox-associated membrane protein [Actinomycetota bacterium]
MVARIVLGGVFLLSGATKLVDRSWPESASAFGLPRLGALALPPVELVVGALIVVGIGGAGPVLVGAGLLVGFTAAILVLLARGGEAPACACFGAWSRRPISGRTVGRNVVLLAVAAVTLVA